MRTWSQRSLSNMEGIHPDLRAVLDLALQESPIDFVVIEGLRTRERQAEMVATGKSRTMNSRHLTGHAVDLWPIDPETGRGADGNNSARLWRLYERLGPAVERAAKSLNVALVWGGRWTSFRDGPHFELERHAYPTGVDVAAATEKAREKPVESKTVQASAADLVVKGGGAVAAATAGLSGLDWRVAVAIVAVLGVSAVLSAIILRERLRAWAKGWR